MVMHHGTSDDENNTGEDYAKMKNHRACGGSIAYIIESFCPSFCCNPHLSLREALCK